jgi:hypothetical protein
MTDEFSVAAWPVGEVVPLAPCFFDENGNQPMTIDDMLAAVAPL